MLNEIWTRQVAPDRSDRIRAFGDDHRNIVVESFSSVVGDAQAAHPVYCDAKPSPCPISALVHVMQTMSGFGGIPRELSLSGLPQNYMMNSIERGVDGVDGGSKGHPPVLARCAMLPEARDKPL